MCANLRMRGGVGTSVLDIPHGCKSATDESPPLKPEVEAGLKHRIAACFRGRPSAAASSLRYDQ